MCTFEKIADKSSTICVGALAFALGDPSGGIVVATGLGGLAAVGIALRKNCAKRARENAFKATIVALRDTPEFDGVNLERANALLQDRQEHTTLNSGHLIAAYKHGAKEARIAALVELLHATIRFDGDTNQIKTLLRHALTAAMRSCYDDKDFRAQLNEETLIDIARKTDGLTTMLDRVENGPRRSRLAKTKSRKVCRIFKTTSAACKNNTRMTRKPHLPICVISQLNLTTPNLIAKIGKT